MAYIEALKTYLEKVQGWPYIKTSNAVHSNWGNIDKLYIKGLSLEETFNAIFMGFGQDINYQTWEQLEAEIEKDKLELGNEILTLISAFESKYKQHYLSVTGIRRKVDPDNISISKTDLEIGYTINAQIGL